MRISVPGIVIVRNDSEMLRLTLGRDDSVRQFG
jgi:hypothetical protein